MEDWGLTKKQVLFANEYMIDFNATRAYKAAYPHVKNDNTAGVNAYNLLRNPKISVYIDHRKEERIKVTTITQERVLLELARLAFFDPRKLYDDDGNPKPIQDLDDDTAACIAGLDIAEIWEGRGEDRVFVGYTKKYKLTDKKGSLELLGRHMAMFRDKIELSGKVDIGANPFAGLTTEELRELINRDKG